MRKTACVTGAASGLGYSLAEILVKNNYLVFAGYHSRIKEELARLREKYPDQVMIERLDVSDIESVKQFKKVIEKEAGHLDLILKGEGKPFEKLAMNRWHVRKRLLMLNCCHFCSI